MNPGIYDLGSRPINTAVTDLVITDGVSVVGVPQGFLDNLEGMASCTLDVFFTYGAGGTDAVAKIETSLDQGATWIEVARFRFTTASGEKVMALRADKEIEAAVDATTTLTNDTARSGIFGDRWRARLTTTGTYTGATTIAARMHAR